MVKKEISVKEKSESESELESDNVITNEDINGEGTVQEDNIEVFYNNS